VALGAGTAVVGAPFVDWAGFDAGAAWVFVRAGGAWTEQARLVPDDAAEDDEFGIAVAQDGDTALVGAWLDDDAGERSGSA